MRYFSGTNIERTVTRQLVNDSTNLPNIQYAIRVQRNSGTSNTLATNISYNLETVDSIPYAGKTITFSFYARAGANFSAANLSLALRSGTGTDQLISSGYTGSVNLNLVGATLTTSWQRFTRTATVPTNATQIGWILGFTPVGTAGANDWFEITGVQLEAGPVATPFKRNANSIQGELAACQRYYQRIIGTAAYTNFGLGYASGTTTAQIFYNLPVQMRVVPTSLEFSTVQLAQGGSTYAVSALTIDSFSCGNQGTLVNATSTGLPTANPVYLRGNNSATAHVAFSAEL
jgi:hypothetical protein